MFLICDRQTRGGRRRRSCCCSGYANTCDKTLQQIVMLNFWSQSKVFTENLQKKKKTPLLSHPKTKLQIFKILLFYFILFFQLRSTWRGKNKGFIYYIWKQRTFIWWEVFDFLLKKDPKKQKKSLLQKMGHKQVIKKSLSNWGSQKRLPSGFLPSFLPPSLFPPPSFLPSPRAFWGLILLGLLPSFVLHIKWGFPSTISNLLQKI
jgi:hypothetical protein